MCLLIKFHKWFIDILEARKIKKRKCAVFHFSILLQWYFFNQTTFVRVLYELYFFAICFFCEFSFLQEVALLSVLLAHYWLVSVSWVFVIEFYRAGIYGVVGHNQGCWQNFYQLPSLLLIYTIRSHAPAPSVWVRQWLSIKISGCFSKFPEHMIATKY